ncbi:MAG: hypothetical protein MUO23_04115 [Anaerolineales bacterium]|nr:hypothetical protein [Anaerolineales bacterium]
MKSPVLTAGILVRLASATACTLAEPGRATVPRSGPPTPAAVALISATSSLPPPTMRAASAYSPSEAIDRRGAELRLTAFDLGTPGLALTVWLSGLPPGVGSPPNFGSPIFAEVVVFDRRQGVPIEWASQGGGGGGGSRREKAERPAS